MHNVRREDLQTKAIKRARTGAVIKISGYCALISGSRAVLTKSCDQLWRIRKKMKKVSNIKKVHTTTELLLLDDIIFIRAHCKETVLTRCATGCFEKRL